ncbi:Fc.00g045240.m01.CDS01 [Cosmosporella sp. VM-42]
MYSGSAVSKKGPAAKDQMSASSLSSEAHARLLLPRKPIQDTLASQPAIPEAPSWVDTSVLRLNPIPPQSTYSSSHRSHDLRPSSISTPSADDHIRAFQNNMTSHFPFIVIPTGTTAEELRITKPFLYHNIMMVTSYPNVSRQAQSRSEVVKSFTEQIFLQGKKSLDLVQGIIVFVAWYHHHLSDSADLTNMVQLATALVFDLGLHRTQNPFGGQDIPIESIKNFGDKWMKPARTLEERRTFLGLYCLSRGLSANLGKIEPLQDTPYVEECRVELETRQEYLSDRYLVLQVQLQNIADASRRSFPFHSVDYWSQMGTETIRMLVKSFEKDLEQFKISLESGLIQSTLFRIHLASISIHNTEIALRKSPSAEKTPPTSNPARLGLLMTCLQSTKSFFTEWLSLPSNVYHRLPVNVFATVAHAAVILGMLNLFHYDAWDLNYVREVASFPQTMDKLAQKYEEASRETDDGENSGWSEFCKGGVKMTRLIDWYEARLKGLMRWEDQRNENQETSVALDMNMFDDWFWNEPIDVIQCLWADILVKDRLGNGTADAVSKRRGLKKTEMWKLRQNNLGKPHGNFDAIPSSSSQIDLGTVINWIAVWGSLTAGPHQASSTTRPVKQVAYGP